MYRRGVSAQYATSDPIVRPRVRSGTVTADRGAKRSNYAEQVGSRGFFDQLVADLAQNDRSIFSKDRGDVRFHLGIVIVAA